jgi:hypothetical protein
MRLFVKPKNGMIIRDPKTQLPLPEGGKEVPDNSFWTRRIQGGDVELASRKEVQKAENKKSKSKSDSD